MKIKIVTYQDSLVKQLLDTFPGITIIDSELDYDYDIKIKLTYLSDGDEVYSVYLKENNKLYFMCNTIESLMRALKNIAPKYLQEFVD